MATSETTNLQLVKYGAGTDNFIRTDYNGNLDKIDTFAGNTNEAIANMATKETGTVTKESGIGGLIRTTKINNVCTIDFIGVTGISAQGSKFATVPTGFRPSSTVCGAAVIQNGSYSTGTYYPAYVEIDSSGEVIVRIQNSYLVSGCALNGTLTYIL